MNALLARLIRWMLKKIGARNLLALGLMLSAQISVAYGLNTAIRRLPDYYLINAVIVGVLAGWLLGASRWKPYWTAAAGLIVSVIWNLIAASKTGILILQLIATSLGLLFRIPWKVDLTPLFDLFLLLASSIQATLVQLNGWLVQALQGNLGYSTVAAAFFWGLCCWLCAAWGGWWLHRRREPLPALLPGGLLLAGVLNYTRAPALSLAALLSSLLLLLALEHYAAREARWEKHGLDFSEELRMDMAVAAISLSLGLSALAGAAPSFSIKPLVEAARRVAPAPQSRPLAESLGLRSKPGESSAPLALGSGGLPRQHLIGSGDELSQQLIFTVSTNDTPPLPSEGYNNPLPQRYYWRGMSYDVYTGLGWQSSPTVAISYAPGMLTTEEPGTPGRYLIQKIDGAVELNDILYTAGMPVAADLPVRGLWRTPPEAGAYGDWFAFTVSSNQYQATSWLNTASAQDLRQSGDQYPDEIARRYLQLPESLPERVRQLAGRLVQDQPSPYDRALAIESYLRRYAYNLDLPHPPDDRDLVDYFLFELQEGYCDYYATSMVVLARVAGIPARLVTGYASGAYEPLNARYRVVEADAHSWPELFFPGFGWIEFEPTGGLSAIERPETSDSAALSAGPPPLPAMETAPLAIFERVRMIVNAAPGLAVTLLIGVAAAIWFTLYYLQKQLTPPERAMELMLTRLKLHAQRLDINTPPGQTAHELVATLQHRLNLPRKGGIWENLLSTCQTELENWVQAYTRAMYGPPPPLESTRIQTISSWRKLRWRLWLARYWQPNHPDAPAKRND